MFNKKWNNNKWYEIDDLGGFEDIPEDEKWTDKICRSPYHDPPMHLYIPPGKRYRHVCPACGKETVIYGSRLTWKDPIKDDKFYCKA